MFGVFDFELATKQRGKNLIRQELKKEGKCNSCNKKLEWLQVEGDTFKKHEGEEEGEEGGTVPQQIFKLKFPHEFECLESANVSIAR